MEMPADTTLPPTWQFLAPWFESVADAFSLADADRLDSQAVRIGRDADDRWIDVQFIEAREDDDFSQAEKIRTRHRQLRETMMLMAVLADCDSDAWVRELLRANPRIATAPFVKTTAEPLACKFSLTFSEFADVEAFEFESLADLIGDSTWSAAFQRDFATACALAKELHPLGASWRVTPIPLRLEYGPGHRGEMDDEVDILKGMTRTVQRLQMIEDAFRSDQRAADMTGIPVFELDSIDVYVRSFVMETTLGELQKLVETGVRISSLTLPTCMLYGEMKEDELRLQWASLVATICGHPPSSSTSRRSARVDHLVVPHVYAENAYYLVPLCAALIDTKSLKTLRIETARMNQSVWDLHAHLWPWLAFTVFGKHATWSVEVLEIKGAELWDKVVDKFEAVMGASSRKEALHELWRQTTSADSLAAPLEDVSVSQRTDTSVVVRHGTVLKQQYAGVLILEPSAYAVRLVRLGRPRRTTEGDDLGGLARSRLL